jgi:DNA-binding transcriptional LysR family regulator
MSRPDLNLLVTLDVLLAEGSVARAARRLRLSPSAMSRALARLRETTGDPLLVRAGRGLVPTPRAIELRERVSQLVQDGEAVLRPTEKLNLKQLARTFTLRTSEGFVENFGPSLMARMGDEAPGVRLCFVQKPDKDSTSLRDGSVEGRRRPQSCVCRHCSETVSLASCEWDTRLAKARSRRLDMRPASTSSSRDEVSTGGRLMKP